MRLDDIDWVRGCLLVPAEKTHRDGVSRCPKSENLAAYLQHARPASVHQELFLRWRPPFSPLQSSTSISTLTRKLLPRGHSRTPVGAHTLRHSLATGLVCNGELQIVADVLGHQALATTEIYAKLDGSLAKSRCVARRCTMTTPDLLLHVEAYIGLRKALSYAVRSDEKLLKICRIPGSSDPRTNSCPAGHRLGVSARARTRPIGPSFSVKNSRGFLLHLRATWRRRKCLVPAA